MQDASQSRPCGAPRRRIRSRRRTTFFGAALASVALAALTTGSTTLTIATRASAGPVAAPGESPLDPCRIPATLGVQMSEGMPTPPGYAHSTGIVRALTLMIDFPDAQGSGTALSRYKEFFPQTSNWFRNASYGRLDYRPEAPIPQWLRMPKAFSAYGIDRGSPYEPGYHRLVQDMIAAAGSRVNFSKYDLVNVLVTPNAGPSALDTVLSVTFSGNEDAPYADGVPLSNTSFVYSRQDDGSGSYSQTGYRVLPHENGHVFGLPDLYTAQGGGAVGHWDIMSEDWGANNDMLGWHKWKLGWLDNSQVSCVTGTGEGQYALTPLSTEGGPKLLFVPVTKDSGYAVEVRTQTGNDEAVCKPGVLIYRVDATIDTGRGPVTISDSEPTTGGCTRRPNVNAELSDAPYTTGETFTDHTSGVRIAVTGVDGMGNYHVKITRS
ncbi:M6 family metalloprotease domain-containing protein [Streptomyces sp. NPDC006632]|uniref:M6 family metalloprotease domain-containing protein n=1 Tax=unclassified Streptomyces TaxID=2593676 RepID=UPI002E1FFA49